ncbi:hypothetical protein [Iningainema tapete]|uniref:Uncharacterized protein n=1 Tax=Iningainema tapete BLCC-T55 TaxID=2748662 RepID=A0A8J7BXN5_9CYAN|nr:hypothetical protein [Iningainema tapete]MBD2773253.1 hypothetical protein [Iningainema tapete BLCC-T55]
MAQKADKIRVLPRINRILQELVEFIIGPWLYRKNTKPLQEKVYQLEQYMYKDILKVEKRLELMIGQLQQQLEQFKEETKTQIENIKSNLPNQEEDIQKTVNISQILKPTVEVLQRELEDKQQGIHEHSATEIQSRLQQTLRQLESLTSSLPQLELQRIASLEAGKWLLAHRAELAQMLSVSLLNPYDTHTEEFNRNIRQYLKLLGHCLENGIEPKLLYQQVVTHQHPPVEIYLQAFDLITKQVSDWESQERVSPQAAIELRKCFNYVSDYLTEERQRAHSRRQMV